jgi:MFS transporter, DHA2 family, multidrug resistance protein
VVIPTFMEVLDTTIANVALRYIAGGLVAPGHRQRMGHHQLPRRQRDHPAHLRLARFAIGPAKLFSCRSPSSPSPRRCAAWPPAWAHADRLPRAAGPGRRRIAAVQPGVLLDAFPPEKQGGGHDVFGIAALLAPVVGPTLGGYITDNYGWRWIFYINVPVGLFALVICHAVVDDPDYLKGRAAKRASSARFDTLGLCLLSVTMVCWEIMLSKGQEWDWLGDPFWRVQTLLPSLSCSAWAPDLSANCASPIRWSISARCWTATSAPAASSSSAPTACSTPTPPRCRACCNRSSATTRPPPAWCFRRPGLSR